ncbi:MAG: single-stranded-DNA-specific exonuclease RecJ [Candidatus Omnitrophota bacterium]
MKSHKILNIHPADESLQNLLSKELKISKIVAQLLINRGIKNVPQADKFLNVKIQHFLDPYTFSDMKLAVDLIKKAAKNKEKVLICGDYDVDGITSVALLKNTFSGLGLKTSHYIPHRVNDGYGLNKNVVTIAKEKNIKLLVTADCGTSSYEEIKELRRQNRDVILTDHHEPSNCNLPEASAIINPKIKNCPYKFKDLAGVGVAYKLCQALTGSALIDDLDLVSLGTIADVVPLVDENRIIVKEGLLRLTMAKRTGIKSLIEVSRINDREINSTFVSFILGPRINASGRMDTAETALSLLMSQDKEEADIFAKSVDTYNRKRQKVEARILEEAQNLINKEINFKEHKIIILAKEGWHQGVLGIVAAKLADRFYRPTIVISLSGNLCKGSGRSIKNFHLFHALLECKEHLETFGGHSHAIGLLITKDNIKGFKEKINQLAKEKLKIEDLLPGLDVDMELDLDSLTEGLAQEIKALEPFGTGNSEPLFFARNLKLKGQPQVLSRDTLKFWVTDGNVTCSVIAFGMGSLKDSLLNAECLDLVYSLAIDNWRQQNTLILQAKDLFFR